MTKKERKADAFDFDVFNGTVAYKYEKSQEESKTRVRKPVNFLANDSDYSSDSKDDEVELEEQLCK